PRRAADFNRHIRPILAKNCYACHGPDDSKRQAQLRLDQRDAAIAALPSGTAAIVPGDAPASELYRRITSADADVRMPPAETGLALNEHQIELLRAWIEQGAPYAEHWAFVPPKRPP